MNAKLLYQNTGNIKGKRVGCPNMIHLKYHSAEKDRREKVFDVKNIVLKHISYRK